MRPWSIAVLAVVGAFLVGGIGGAFASSALGVWDVPGSGFLAALGVVCVAYLAAPSRKLAFAATCFFLGLIAAWLLLGDTFYPESYRERAYQDTSMPFVVTCGGGFLGLFVVFVFDRWRRLHGA